MFEHFQTCFVFFLGQVNEAAGATRLFELANKVVDDTSRKEDNE
jgi:hypothetical protein